VIANSTIFCIKSCQKVIQLFFEHIIKETYKYRNDNHLVREMMGIMTTFFRFWNHQAERIAEITIRTLKQVASEDRARLSDEDVLLYSRESLMNKLEFSRPVCVKEYIKQKGAAGDALLSTLLLQFA
jgi:hypothetical protein